MRLSLISGVTQTGTKIMLRDGREGKGKAAGQAVALGPRGRRVLVGGTGRCHSPRGSLSGSGGERASWRLVTVLRAWRGSVGW